MKVSEKNKQHRKNSRRRSSHSPKAANKAPRKTKNRAKRKSMKKALFDLKRKIPWMAIVKFVAFQLVFAAITMPLLIFYGPFGNIKNTIVGTSWATWKHQYIAKFFLSDSAIERIVGSEFAEDLGEDIIDINIDPNPINKIEVINIEGGILSGKLIKVYDPTRVKVGYSSQLPSEGEPTSTIAQRYGAVAAINAGGLVDKNWTGVGEPYGVIIHNGNIIYNDTQLGERVEIIGFRDNGMLVVGKYTLEVLKEMSVNEAITFGPTLILNGKPAITGNNDGGWGIAPRTAIGQTIDGVVLLLVIDGRSVTSGFGATLRDVQDILLENGAYNAANLDGGSSTTMYYNGKVINEPSDSLGERSVPSIFMVLPDGRESSRE